MARLIEDMENEIDAWFRTRMDRRGVNCPESVMSSLAVKLAGYRKEFNPSTSEIPKHSTPNKRSQP